MKKFISWFLFIVVSAIVIVIFITSTSYLQLGIAIILYLSVTLTAFKIFPRKITPIPVTVVPQPIKTAETQTPNLNESAESKEDEPDVVDVEKRSFLKLISVSGIAFFLSWLFTNKASNPFFGGSPAPETVSVKDAEGKKINPSEKQSTDGYKITEIDDSIIAYYGFTHKDESWFIMRLDTDTGSFRYSRGTSLFTAGWANREHLNYDYYVNVFK